MRAPEIAVEHDVGRGPQPSVIEIHQEECQIVKRIDCGELLVELDGVEQCGPPVPHDDVAKMQISVAAADEPLRCPLVQHRGRTGVLNFRELAKSCCFFGSQNAGNIGEVTRDGTDEVTDALGAAWIICGLSRRVAFERGIGQAASQFSVDTTCICDASQQVGLSEPAHPHRPFHRLPFAIECEPAVTFSGYGNAAEINLRRPLAIDLDLALAHGVPLLQRRQIHVGKAHGTLDFPGLIAREKHDRAVRLKFLELDPDVPNRRRGRLEML